MQSKSSVSAANIDKSVGMQAFLKQLKMLKELNKGVATMKQFIFPSVLQSAAMPLLKKRSTQKNVIVRYSEMSGIKLTLLLPLINQ